MNRDKSKLTKKNQIDNYRKSISYCINKQHQRNHLLKLNMGFNSQIISNASPDKLASIIANMNIKEHFRNNRTDIERQKQVESKLEDYPHKDGIKIVIHSHNIRLKTNRKPTSNCRISTEPTVSEYQEKRKRSLVTLKEAAVSGHSAHCRFQKYRPERPDYFDRISGSQGREFELPKLKELTLRKRVHKEQLKIQFEPWETRKDLFNESMPFKAIERKERSLEQASFKKAID